MKKKKYKTYRKHKKFSERFEIREKKSAPCQRNRAKDKIKKSHKFQRNVDKQSQ